MKELIIVIVITAIIILSLYQKCELCSIERRLVTNEELEVSTQLKSDMKLLLDKYYEEYIYPEEYPSLILVIPSHKSETSYKKFIHVCTTNKETGELFDYNTLAHVAVHELSHSLCKSYDNDHGAEFQMVMNRLNDIAIELKVYDPALKVSRHYKQACSH